MMTLSSDITSKHTNQSKIFGTIFQKQVVHNSNSHMEIKTSLDLSIIDYGFLTHTVETPVPFLDVSAKSINDVDMINLKRINEISILKDNWDGYESKSIPKELISIVSSLLYSVGYKCDIMPTIKPSVILKFSFRMSELYIEIEKDYYTVFIYKQDGNFRDLNKISYSNATLTQTVRSFFGFA